MKSEKEIWWDDSKKNINNEVLKDSKYENEFLNLNDCNSIYNFMDMHTDLYFQLDFWTDKMMLHFQEIINCNEDKFLEIIGVNPAPYMK